MKKIKVIQDNGHDIIVAFGKDTLTFTPEYREVTDECADYMQENFGRLVEIAEIEEEDFIPEEEVVTEEVVEQPEVTEEVPTEEVIATAEVTEETPAIEESPVEEAPVEVEEPKTVKKGKK
jgi:hypothetical protein